HTHTHTPQQQQQQATTHGAHKLARRRRLPDPQDKGVCPQGFRRLLFLLIVAVVGGAAALQGADQCFCSFCRIKGVSNVISILQNPAVLQPLWIGQGPTLA
ncbi:hypothetical protein DFJ73DRAFT_963273, partial [Zopfochytrium polystomum]